MTTTTTTLCMEPDADGVWRLAAIWVDTVGAEHDDCVHALGLAAKVWQSKRRYDRTELMRELERFGGR